MILATSIRLGLYQDIVVLPLQFNVRHPSAPRAYQTFVKQSLADGAGQNAKLFQHMDLGMRASPLIRVCLHVVFKLFGLVPGAPYF